ncbi:MAG TPA: hypothetical protein VGB76_22385 [Pyrinomonadaceae bacterium]
MKFQAELQSRMERDTREYEEARQTLLKQAGDDERDRQNIEHAA